MSTGAGIAVPNSMTFSMGFTLGDKQDTMEETYLSCVTNV